MKQIAAIRFLKGFAIFTIMIYHYMHVLHLPSPIDKLIIFGGSGIHLFVFLSGFGLYLSQLNKPLSFSEFLKRRTLKLYIPYIFIVFITAAISVVIPIYKNTMYTLGGHVFLYKMFDESIIGSYGYPLWFISMIIQFYFVFNILGWVAKKIKPKQFLLLCFAISISWFLTVIVLHKESERIWSSFFLQYLWEFALGMYLAIHYKSNNYTHNISIKPRYTLIIGLVNCAIYAVLSLKGGVAGRVINDIPAFIGYSFIAIWLYQINIKPIIIFLNFIGDISFSLYLLHTLILVLCLKVLSDLPLGVELSIAFILTYATAYYFQKLVHLFFKLAKL